MTFLQRSEPGFWRRKEWPIDPPGLEEGPGLPWRPGPLSGWHSALDGPDDPMEGVNRAPARMMEERALQGVYRELMYSIPPE